MGIIACIYFVRGESCHAWIRGHENGLGYKQEMNCAFDLLPVYLEHGVCSLVLMYT